MTARGDSLRCSRNPGSNFRSGLIAPREYRPRCRRRRRVAKVSCTAGRAKSDGNFRESCIARRRRSLPSASMCSTTRSIAKTFLRHGYALARANAGAPGMDGMTFAAIEASGLDSMVGGLARGTGLEDVPARSGAAGDDPEAGWRRATARHSNDPGSGGPSRRQARAGTDLRGGLRGQCLRLSSRTRGGGRSQGSAPACLPGLHRRGRRRLVSLLRFNSTRRTPEVSSSSHRGPARAAADQAVAESADRGTG